MEQHPKETRAKSLVQKGKERDGQYSRTALPEEKMDYKSPTAGFSRQTREESATWWTRDFTPQRPHEPALRGMGERHPPFSPGQ